MEQEVRGVNDRRFAALVQSETAELSRLLAARFTAVYVRLGGAWKLVAWQTTRLPEG